MLGRHTIKQGLHLCVTTSLVTDPLKKAGLSIKDIDKYSVEMQNPEITVPAGAGDVPLANYKMIAALGVKQGILERSELNDFVDRHGMKGWAPTQGHIPSGVPFMGFAREAILKGEMTRAMIIGKGSLFLGRMTNLLMAFHSLWSLILVTKTLCLPKLERNGMLVLPFTAVNTASEKLLRCRNSPEKQREYSCDRIGPKNDCSLTTVASGKRNSERLWNGYWKREN